MKSATLIIKGDSMKYVREHAERLGFKDASSMISFLIALAGRSATHTFMITDIDGRERTVMPIEKMLK